MSKVESDCIDAFNELIAKRRVVFGSEGLKKWHEEADPPCGDPKLKETLEQHLTSLGGREDVGTRDVPAESLAEAIAQTGPGGSVTITVTAKAYETKYYASLKTERTLLETIPADQKEAIEKHQEPRVFIVEFGPPRGVSFSFGPYLAGIERKEFDQVRNPDHDPTDTGSSEFIIDLTEDSNFSYGVAAYWSTSITKNQSSGISWGVAYTLSNELDTSVNGLMGMYYSPGAKRSAGMIHFGLAIGRESDLSGTREEGGPIGDTEEIPTTLATKVSFFVGYGFRFDSR